MDPCLLKIIYSRLYCIISSLSEWEIFFINKWNICLSYQNQRSGKQTIIKYCLLFLMDMFFCVCALIAKQTLWTCVYMFSMFSMILKLSFLECFRNNRKTVVMIILKNSQENICGGIFLSSKVTENWTKLRIFSRRFSDIDRATVFKRISVQHQMVFISNRGFY